MLILGIGILSVGLFFLTKIGSESNDMIKWVEQNKGEILKERFCTQDTIQRGVCIYPNNLIESPKVNRGVIITIYNIFGENIKEINIENTNDCQDLEHLGIGSESVDISPGEEYNHFIALRKKTAGVCTFKVEIKGAGDTTFITDSFSFTVK